VWSGVFPSQSPQPYDFAFAIKVPRPQRHIARSAAKQAFLLFTLDDQVEMKRSPPPWRQGPHTSAAPAAAGAVATHASPRSPTAKDPGQASCEAANDAHVLRDCGLQHMM
jgi:hypothetical protein